MKKLRAAIIGLAHIHVINMTVSFSAHPDMFDIVGMADIPPYTEEERAARIKKNVPADSKVPLYDDYKELLKKDIDVAIICTDIADHARITVEVLEMGIHAVVEKPFSITSEDSKLMYEAYKNSNAELFVNWPIAWFPAFKKAKELADAGEVGEVLRVQYRSPATSGPCKPGEFPEEELLKMWWYHSDRGGGSICDYAGYGFVLTTWITGEKAKSVYGVKRNYVSKFSDIEDYSAFIIDFGEKVGFIEGSWSTFNSGEIPTGPIIYGTKGVIVADRFDKEVKVYTDFAQYIPCPPPNKTFTPEETDDDVASNIYRYLTLGEPLCEMISADFNVKAQAALSAGIRSCNIGNSEIVGEY